MARIPRIMITGEPTAYHIMGRLGDVHKYINCCYDHLCIYVRPYQSLFCEIRNYRITILK